MLQPTTKDHGIDLTKPIDLDSLGVTLPSCFGQEWHPKHSECTECTLHNVCCKAVYKNLRNLEQDICKPLNPADYD